MDIRETLAQLAGANAEEVAAALREVLQPVYQIAFNAGHSTATTKAAAREASLNDLLAAEREKRAALEAEIQTLKDKAPDVQAMRQQYEARISELESQVESVRTEGIERAKSILQRKAISDLQAILAGQLGVDPDYAEVLVSKPGVISRIKVDEVGDEFEIAVLQEGREIPIQADKPLRAYAEELRKSVPAKFVVSRADRGGGSQGGGAGGGLSVFDQIRENAKRRNEQRTGSKSAAERMGMV